MTIEQMTALGEIARVLIYNPVTYSIVILIFLVFLLGDTNHE